MRVRTPMMSFSPSKCKLSKLSESRSADLGAGSIIACEPQNAGIDGVLAEFRKSAIPDRLTLANVEWIEGRAALQIMAETATAYAQSSTSFVGKSAGDILKTYAFIEAGGWFAWGQTIDGGQGEVAYAKPLTPRTSKKNKGFGEAPKNSIVKYETPQGLSATPLLPWVDPETAQIIFDRYHAIPEAGESFWQTVKRCNIPFAITEGLKKALALTAHGLPSIAVRGITQWRTKGTDELHPDILDLLGEDASVYVVFDQDDKVKTQKAVQGQLGKLSRALIEAGASLEILQWDGSLGKGIDDVLYHSEANGSDAQTCLDDLLKKSIDFKTYQTNLRTQRAIENINLNNSLTYPVERATEGEYLPELPKIEKGAIHVLSATMNAGKTTRIGQDYVKSWTERSGLVLVLTPINNLGKQAAADWELPHIHDYATDRDSQNALWSEVNHRGGVVMCGESLHRIPEWFWNKPVLLILDEANQIIEGLTEGNTLGSRYSLILEKFTAATRCAIETGAIVLSEDGIPDRAVKFIETISGAQKVRVSTHRKILQPWETILYHGQQPARFRGEFIGGVRKGQRRIYVTASQREAEKMDRALQISAPDIKAIRIDSKTNQEGRFTAFFENPDQWLKDNQPDVLILSPSAKSGVSIEGGVSVEDAYFHEVWGYFPALGTDTHMQMLGRYRPSVPRRVFCPQFIMKSSDESITSTYWLKHRLTKNTNDLSRGFGLGDLLDEENTSADRLTIESAILEYISVAKSVSGSQKQIAHHALLMRLEKAGHIVTSEASPNDPEWAKFFKKIREMLWEEEATEIATAQIDESHTIEWARKALDGLDTTLKTRTIAHKVIWRAEFPGVMFDDAGQCEKALTRDYGAMARGVQLQARAENLEASKLEDAKLVEDILSGNIRALHRFPKKHVQAALIAASGVLDLMDGYEYDSDHFTCQKVKAWALNLRNEIYYWLRLTIKEEHSAVSICHKLLKKMGIVREKKDQDGLILLVGQFGSREDRTEVFRIDTDPESNYTRYQLLEAARRKLYESVQSTCKEKASNIQINCTNEKNHRTPPPIGEGLPDFEEDEWTFEFEFPEEDAE